MNENFDIEAWLQEDLAPVAVYFSDSDCIEYVNEDTTSVYKRIDQFLTLIYDETALIPIGFKLKGFRHVFLQMKNAGDVYELDFVDVIKIIERICTSIGEEMFADASRTKAYQAVRKLAKDVVLHLPEAA